MRDRKMVQEKVDKLDAVWSSMKESSSSGYQRILLRHLLGELQDNLSINIIHKSIYDEIDIDPEILYDALCKGVSKLLTRAYSNSVKTSVAVNDLTEINKELQSNSKILNQRISRMDTERNDLINQITSLQGMLSDMEDKIYELEEANRNLKNENKKLFNELGMEKSKIRMDKSSELKLQMEKELQKNVMLSDKNNELAEHVKELDIKLSGYQENEKKLLPLLQQTVYCKEHVGKSITLVPSQIESIVRGHLNGDSPYLISKSLGVSKTSVNKILSCDYRTVNSLKKILDALHRINGNWGIDKKQRLDDLISNYESELRQAEEKAEILRSGISNRVVDIDGYLQETEMSKKNI